MMNRESRATQGQQGVQGQRSQQVEMPFGKKMMNGFLF